MLPQIVEGLVQIAIGTWLYLFGVGVINPRSRRPEWVRKLTWLFVLGAILMWAQGIMKIAGWHW